MLTNAGIVLIGLGIMAADSEWLIIPVALIAVGVILYKAGERKGE